MRSDVLRLGRGMVEIDFFLAEFGTDRRAWESWEKFDLEEKFGLEKHDSDEIMSFLIRSYEVGLYFIENTGI